MSWSSCEASQWTTHHHPALSMNARTRHWPVHKQFPANIFFFWFMVILNLLNFTLRLVKAWNSRSNLDETPHWVETRSVPFCGLMVSWMRTWGTHSLNKGATSVFIAERKVQGQLPWCSWALQLYAGIFPPLDRKNKPHPEHLPHNDFLHWEKKSILHWKNHSFWELCTQVCTQAIKHAHIPNERAQNGYNKVTGVSKTITWPTLTKELVKVHRVLSQSSPSFKLVAVGNSHGEEMV